ncbi:MAG: hypothetical protein ABIT01_02085 [Thermoanaerobaculia bacterium]
MCELSSVDPTADPKKAGALREKLKRLFWCVVFDRETGTISLDSYRCQRLRA